jgi:superoxide reductase
VTHQGEIYRCDVCGNVVEVFHPGGGVLVCCGQNMTLVQEKEHDLGEEKHLPVIEKTEKGIRVQVGFVLHPMEPDHYIEWIEVIGEGARQTRMLQPNDQPMVEFEIPSEKVQTVRVYCNLHGLWRR